MTSHPVSACPKTKATAATMVSMTLIGSAQIRRDDLPTGGFGFGRDDVRSAALEFTGGRTGAQAVGRVGRQRADHLVGVEVYQAVS